MMPCFRSLFLTIGLAATMVPSHAAAPAVGTVSAAVDFAVHNGVGLADADLSAYDGKILVMMLMTPW